MIEDYYKADKFMDSLIMFPAMPEMWAAILILVCAGMMIMSFSFYLPVYIRLWKGKAAPSKAAP